MAYFGRKLANFTDLTEKLYSKKIIQGHEIFWQNFQGHEIFWEFFQGHKIFWACRQIPSGPG